MAAHCVGCVLSALLPFLHRLDSLDDQAQLVFTDHERLRSAGFLDGREQFWSSDAVTNLDELSNVTEVRPLNFIFHTGFCGSTLMARLCDEAQHRFVLKEPQALADGASQYVPLMDLRDKPAADRALALCVAGLASAAAPDEETIIKPSCWVNPLLPHLVAGQHVERAVFMTQKPRAHLLACFRGDRERLAYCARQAEMMALYDQAMAEKLNSAIAEAGDPLERIARIVALLHAEQCSLFTDAARTLGEERSQRIQLPSELEQIAECASDAAKFLAPSSAPMDQQKCARILKRDAKDTERQFVKADHDAQDTEIEKHHGPRFDKALAWLAQL